MALDVKAYEDHVKAVNGELQSLAAQVGNISTEVEHIGTSTKNDALTAIATRLFELASKANYVSINYPKLATDD